MRRGYDILKSQVGHNLSDGIIQAFYFDKKLSARIQVTYLKFDKWLHITTTDNTAILIVESPPSEQTKSFDTDNNQVEFKWTKIQIVYPEFISFIGHQLVAFDRLIQENRKGIVSGLKLYFDNSLTFTIYTDESDNSHYVFDNEMPTNFDVATNID